MEGKHSDLEAFAAQLLSLRKESGVSQAELAKRSGISTEPIKSGESGTHIPKAGTLRHIAEGLATYRPGRTDPELVEEYYGRLMRAAGYVGEQTEPGDNISLEGLIEGVGVPARRAARIAAFVRKYPNMTAKQLRLVEALLDNLEDD